MSDQKKIFISYSWDSPEHKKWVKKFSDDLQALLEEYFKVLLDQNQRRGTSLSRFMKQGLKDACKVLIIGTPKYKEKSEASGGVAYETMVITNEMMSDMDTTKFYPILRSGTFNDSFPTDIKDRIGDDFSDDKYYEENLKIVVQEIFGDNPIPDIIKYRLETVLTKKRNIKQKGKKQNLDYSLNGVVFSGNKERLIVVPKDKKGSFTIPDFVTVIGNWAFSRCTSLTSIKIPKSVTTIWDFAFSSCTSLKKIIVDEMNPMYLSKDGVLYSKNMSKLIAVPGGKTSIKIPESVTEIWDSAFAGCISLTSIKIPKSVTEIGEWVFNGCTSLNSIVIPESVTKIGNDAFYDCTSLNSIVIPESVTEIGEWVFNGCTSLNSIVIPESVTEIGRYAFSGCRSLTLIKIPESVTEIGRYAFSGCRSLTSIEIPESVTAIGECAFEDCTSLKEIHIKHKTPRDLTSAFEIFDKSQATIFVPKGSGEAYRNHEFYNKFKRIIEK